ncbi:hypothetical protein GCK72_001536 [Caenorhabditis remanei]|uniref:Uncharacterized protein n=1 Tax=Caenorhabditis remanei TaxID=31234 RepID=A0A6A5HPV1_CAERE|nr:hypothetical protein GCK72_001536 [Caenorhabditis remanei]KAF1769719.1 hypothetical protein GCK72_001536 [Caenorhabditis remanei]
MKTTEERKSHCRLVQVLQLILQQPLPSVRRDCQTKVHKPEQLLTQAIRCEEAKDSDEPRTVTTHDLNHSMEWEMHEDPAVRIIQPLVLEELLQPLHVVVNSILLQRGEVLESAWPSTMAMT